MPVNRKQAGLVNIWKGVHPVNDTSKGLGTLIVSGVAAAAALLSHRRRYIGIN